MGQNLRNSHLCKAKPGHDCETVCGLALPLVQVARIKTAAARDAAAKRERRSTSAHNMESRDAEEKLAAAKKRKK